MKCNLPAEYDRIVPVEIDGETLYLNFCAGSANEIDKLQINEENVRDLGFEALVKMVYYLARYGALYVNRKRRKEACGNEFEQVEIYSVEELEVIIPPWQTAELSGKIEEAIQKGGSQEIKAKPKKPTAGRSKKPTSSGTNTGQPS